MPLDNPSNITFPASTKGTHNRVSLPANSARQILDTNASRKSALIQNVSANQVTLQLNDIVGAVVGKGIILLPGGSYEISLLNLHTGKISAISAGDSEITVSEAT